ncbi:MAG TPA: hypothetical protein VNM15_02675 [Candidatus Binatia bacterium]|nr:hypothetical protein [Candidatus Binatia bacterium]
MQARPPRHEKSGVASKAETSLRCCCGSLLARLVAEGVEIKCRRCKRQVILPVAAKGEPRMNM